jgi:hypothetical protein
MTPSPTPRRRSRCWPTPLADGTELPVLDRDRLALCTLEPASTALN